MKIGIAGGNGFIGRNLIKVLREKEYDVIVFHRNDFLSDSLSGKVNDCEVIMNLAGEPITGFWTRQKRENIYNSRILTTRKLVKSVNSYGLNVKVFISVSGVGIYDHLNAHDEDSKNFENDFLSHVIVDWEAELDGLKRSEVKVVVLRLGVVFGVDGGIYPRVARLFRHGLGFSIDSTEYLPFVHIGDVMEVFLMALRNKDFSGVFNVVSPQLLSIHDFFLTMAEVCNSRIRFSISPGFLRALMGESSVVLIRGQRVFPKRLFDMGFIFRFDSMRHALQDIFAGKGIKLVK